MTIHLDQSNKLLRLNYYSSTTGKYKILIHLYHSYKLIKVKGLVYTHITHLHHISYLPFTFIYIFMHIHRTE
jgi:hypothetical protein